MSLTLIYLSRIPSPLKSSTYSAAQNAHATNDLGCIPGGRGGGGAKKMALSKEMVLPVTGHIYVNCEGN